MGVYQAWPELIILWYMVFLLASIAAAGPPGNRYDEADVHVIAETYWLSEGAAADTFVSLVIRADAPHTVGLRQLEVRSKGLPVSSGGWVKKGLCGCRLVNAEAVGLRLWAAGAEASFELDVPQATVAGPLEVRGEVRTDLDEWRHFTLLVPAPEPAHGGRWPQPSSDDAFCAAIREPVVPPPEFEPVPVGWLAIPDPGPPALQCDVVGLLRRGDAQK